MSAHNYYKILGIKKSASLQEIKSRFRQLALRYHPDRNPGNPQAEERFKLVAEAYHVLSDQQRRRLYNRRGYQGLRQQGYQGFQRCEQVFSTLGAEFFSFLGITGSQPHRGPLPGADLCLILDLSPEEASLGGDKTVQITRMESCRRCQGNGFHAASGKQTCAWCGGDGSFSGASGIFTAAGACPKCHGEGRTAQVPCSTCDGLGRCQVQKSIEIKIPAGVTDSTRLKIAREGDGGDSGAEPGDLYLVLRVSGVKE